MCSGSCSTAANPCCRLSIRSLTSRNTASFAALRRWFSLISTKLRLLSLAGKRVGDVTCVIDLLDQDETRVSLNCTDRALDCLLVTDGVREPAPVASNVSVFLESHSDDLGAARV